jgi:hypothetical protein
MAVNRAPALVFAQLGSLMRRACRVRGAESRRRGEGKESPLAIALSLSRSLATNHTHTPHFRLRTYSELLGKKEGGRVKEVFVFFVGISLELALSRVQVR